jgi:hypothetical protein
MRPLISKREYARLRGCSLRLVEKEMEMGIGPPFLKLSGRVQFSPDAIDAYFRERTFCSTAEAARHRQRSAWAAD